jgi:WD40 repeat protein
MRLPTLALLLLLQDPEQPAEWPKDVPKDWARPSLQKEHGNLASAFRVTFGEKGKWILLHDAAGKAVVYETAKWTGGAFLMAGAIPCTGSTDFIRDYTGAVQKIGAKKHFWISDKERPMAVSSDGAMVAIARNDHAVQLYDSSKPEAPRAEFDAHPRGMLDLFFYGKQYLVTVSQLEVRLWNPNKLTEKPKSDGFGNPVRSFATARPDNRYLALSLGKYVRAVEVSTMKGKDLDESLEGAGGLEFSEDGKFLVVWTAAQTATVYWAGGEWKTACTLKGDDAKVALAALHPSGTYVAWTDGKALRITHVASGFEVGKADVLGFKPASMTWQPDGKAIFLCSQTGNAIRVYAQK